jgi:hypothetical protein
MRGTSLLLIAAALGSCSTAPEQVVRSPTGQITYDKLVAGKVAGPPISCLPNYNANDMSVIDSQRVAFRVGGSTTYIMHLSPGCGGLGSGNTALLTKQFGISGLCRGDIAQAFDTLNHMTVGSCVIGDIVPYTKPKS